LSRLLSQHLFSDGNVLRIILTNGDQMNTLSHSKCQKCNKKSNISELKENESGIGLVCKGTQACEKRTSENNK